MFPSIFSCADTGVSAPLTAKISTTHDTTSETNRLQPPFQSEKGLLSILVGACARTRQRWCSGRQNPLMITISTDPLSDIKQMQWLRKVPRCKVILKATSLGCHRKNRSDIT